MIIPLTLLLGLSSMLASEATSIKGHAPARPQEEAIGGRSIKPPSQAAVSPLKEAKSAPQVAAHAPAVPILESSKRVYNDESIRRLVAQQPAAVVPVEQQPAVVPVAAPVAPVQKEAVVAPVVAQQAPVAVPLVKASEQPVVPVVAAPEQPVVVVVAAKEESVVAPKSAPIIAPEPVVVAPVAPIVAPVVPAAAPAPAPIPVPAPVAPAAPVVPVAKVEELPPQSDRSAPIRNEIPSVVRVEQVVPARVPEQPALVAAVPVVQPEPIVKESPLQAKKDEAPVSSAQSDPMPIEVPAPDPGLVLSEPIDSTTKLLIDLDEHVQKFLPAEDQQQPQAAKDQSLVAGVDYSPAGAAVAVAAAPADPAAKSSGPLVPYSGADEPIVPPLPSLDGVEKASAGAQAQASAPASGSASSSSSAASSPSATRQGGQHQNQQQVITQLLDQLDSLQNRIQDTINQLVARRRYVMSALLRPMGTYVRRVRTNLERLQNRVNQLQAAAVSVGGGQNRPGGFVDAAAIETIRRRIDDISKRISDIVNRIRFSLTPTSAPLNNNGRK